MSDRTPLRWFVTLNDDVTYRHCWVDKHVKINDLITLKDSEDPRIVWRVLYVSSQARTVDELNGGRGWHVGGL